ncbi:MAG: N-6 DNA methylase, partial [Proteobacteria bacterium]|nr:N-6 DNA methylase [Pseudomonadota bacterium]
MEPAKMKRNGFSVIGKLAGAFTGRRTEEQGRWMLQWAFRLLAGKILKDKGVPAFADLNLVNFRTVSRLVGNHYRKQDARLTVEGDQQRSALSEAAAQMNGFAHLGRVTTEALADVYESAFVTKETRKALGTHSTPGYLADYVVWQLADWIERIPLTELRVFEPACGHSAFLVSVMRFIREAHPDLPSAVRSRLYRERFCGIEIDALALEIAKLSLTLADIPNPDGWSHVVQGDMFEDDCAALKQGAKQCTVLLANPPFEDGKALRVLKETIPHLPVGAVFGFVLPQAIIYSPKRSAKDFRQWLVRHAQISEICAFPEGIFKFSKHESAILLGRRSERQGSRNDG